MGMLENHNSDIHSVKGMGIILLGGSSLAERDAVIPLSLNAQRVETKW
jgi:hypothetical protein